jgi:hypothetical protein
MFGVLVSRPIHLGFSFKLFELQRLDQDGDGISFRGFRWNGYSRVLATGVFES